MLTVLLLMVSNYLSAQTLTFSDVNKVTKRSNGAIISGKEIKGYYTLLHLDKLDKGTSLFKLIITDENYTKLSEKTFKEDRQMYIADAAFNGENLCIKFVIPDKKGDTQVLRIYNTKGEEVSSKTYPYDIGATYLLYNMSNDDELETFEVHAIPGVGFLNFSAILTKGGMYKRAGVEMQMIPLQGGYANWTYTSPEKTIENPTFLGANKEVAFLSVKRFASNLDKNGEYSIMAIDLKTGKARFDKEFKDERYKLDVVTIEPVSDKESILFGSIIEEEKADKRSKSIGMYIARIDNDGNILNKSVNLWTDVAREFKPVDEKGKPMDIGSVFIHKVVTTSDGRMYAIGERYYKAVSALGVASNILAMAGGNAGSGQSVMKIVIAEMVIMEIGSDLKPKKIDFVDKGKENFELPAYAGTLGTTALGYYVDYFGAFDTYFVQERNDKEGFTASYYNRENKIRYVNTISVYDGQMIKDQIEINQTAFRTYIMPAKPGYISMLQYFRKEKKLEYKLVKYKN